jgi:hypothetical protein
MGTGALLGCVLSAAACARPVDVPAQTPGAAGLDTAAVRLVSEHNRLSGPVQILFEWSLREREARFSGEGATRVAPPDHARLDLFGPRGEGYLSAAFVRGEVRLPQGVTSSPLPPPALLWSALGVFQPPAGATLNATRRDGAALELEYAQGEERWRYRFEQNRLRRVEWTAPRGGRRTVELDGAGAEGLPARAVYRDWPQFVELQLNLNEAIRVDGFPQDIWTIGSE